MKVCPDTLRVQSVMNSVDVKVFAQHRVWFCINCSHCTMNYLNVEQLKSYAIYLTAECINCALQ